LFFFTEAFILFRMRDSKIIKLKNRSQLEPFQLEFAPYDPWMCRQAISTIDPP